MTKEEFIKLCEEPPLFYTSKQAEDLADAANLKEFDLYELYICLYSIYKCIKITEAQADWFDGFRTRL